MVQRTIPHYRLPLFRALAADRRFEWVFFCGQHNGVDAPGMAADLDGLNITPIRNCTVGGPFIWQRGILSRHSEFNAIVAEYGWTILSNPVLFSCARFNGVKTIGWSKGIPQNPQKNVSAIRRKFEMLSISLCDVVVAYGETSRQYFVELGVMDNKIFVSQNTVDTAAIAEKKLEAKMAGARFRSALGIQSVPLIGFLGRIGPAKKVDCVVRAFEYAASRGLVGSLLIAGHGPSSGEIDSMIEQSAFRERIFRVADVPVGTEEAFFQAVDIYISFSQAGLGILEAMAHGIPIVATPERYPETELLVDGQTAFLSKELTVESLGERLVETMNNQNYIGQVAKNAQKVVLEKATIENMKEKICNAVACAVAGYR